MRILRYRHQGSVLVGSLHHDTVCSLPREHSVLDLLAMPKAERDLIDAQAGRHHRIPLADAALVAPLDPVAMRDFVAFEQHVQGVTRSVSGEGGVADAWYEAPAFAFMNPHALTAPGADIPMPPFTRALDFELEVAAIVGRRVRDLDAAEARDAIVGFAVLNDWSARDIQRREMQVGLGPNKGKDFATTLGPCITTPDELEVNRVGDRLRLAMEVSVNGRVVGTDSLEHMAWSFEELLVHASRDAWVGAGDVLATGTCGGGALAEAWGRAGEQVPPPLKVGDIVSMTVEGLGTLTNRIVPQVSPGRRVPPARTFSEARG